MRSSFGITPQNVIRVAKLLLEFNETAYRQDQQETAKQLQANLAESLHHYLTHPILPKQQIEGLEIELKGMIRLTQQLIPYLTKEAKIALKNFLS